MKEVKIYRNIIKLKNIEMFYLDTKTEGPVILCLHGLWGRAETWVDFMKKYGNQYRIIAPDQRGHGLSSKPISKYTGEEMAEDIFELLAELNIESVILVGHSMGGRTAAYLAAQHPKLIKALAILDMSAAGPEKQSSMPLEELKENDGMTQNWPLPFSSLSEASNFIKQASSSNLEFEYFMKSLVETVEGYKMLFSAKAMTAIREYYEDWFHLLPSIKCLVLLIKSSDPEGVPDEDYNKMKSMLSNCIPRKMSHPDHNVHLANKEEFYKYFDEFLMRR